MTLASNVREKFSDLVEKAKTMNQKMAAALQYKPRKDSAPRLVAKGKGWMAEKIIQTAREHNIPLKEDPHLVEILSTLDLYEEIPPDLYKAVAEILIFIYKMNNKVLQVLTG